MSNILEHKYVNERGVPSNVFNIDCLEAMKDYPDNHFELAIVDPPYGINADKAQNNGGEKYGYKKYKDTEWDKEIPIKEYWESLLRVSKNQIVWGGNYMTIFLKPSMGWIIWDKGQRDFSLADAELAWTSFNKAVRIFEMSRGEALAKNNKTGGRIHPTQKPVKLYEWLLLNYAKEGDKILDTHLGSGSSRIAANRLGFEFTGFELDEDYFKDHVKRFENEVAQKRLFE